MAATSSTTFAPSARISVPTRPSVRHLASPAAAIAVLAVLIALLPGIAHVPATDLVARPLGAPLVSTDVGRAVPTVGSESPAHPQPGLDR
jgi:hypothetical protein